MRATLIVLLVLVTFASAQQLMVDDAGNYVAESNMQNFAMDMGLTWLQKQVGVSMDDIKSHLPLLVAAALYYFIEDLDFGFFKGEKVIPQIMDTIFGKDWIEMHTNSAFRMREL